jgi:hypothetical protein
VFSVASTDVLDGRHIRRRDRIKVIRIIQPRRCRIIIVIVIVIVICVLVAAKRKRKGEIPNASDSWSRLRTMTDDYDSRLDRVTPVSGHCPGRRIEAIVNLSLLPKFHQREQ